MALVTAQSVTVLQEYVLLSSIEYAGDIFIFRTIVARYLIRRHARCATLEMLCVRMVDRVLLTIVAYALAQLVMLFVRHRRLVFVVYADVLITAWLF